MTKDKTEEFERPTGRSLDKKLRRDAAKMNKRLQRLQVELVPIDSIYPNAYNPNRQSQREFELLVRSMEEDGFTQPIIVHSQTRQIVDGEHRWRAAHHLDYTHIPAAFVDMTEAQMRISTLRHNRARGSEDALLTAAILSDIRELGGLDQAMQELMISQSEVNMLLEDVSAPELFDVEEFNNAWEPGEHEAGVAVTHKAMTALTPAAQRIVDHHAKVLANTPSPYDRQELSSQQINERYQLSVVFSSDDAAKVIEALGVSQAETLLTWCKLEEAAMAEAQEED